MVAIRFRSIIVYFVVYVPDEITPFIITVAHTVMSELKSHTLYSNEARKKREQTNKYDEPITKVKKGTWNSNRTNKSTPHQLFWIQQAIGNKKLVYFRMNWTLTHDSLKIVTFNCAHRLSFSGAKGKTVYKHPHTIKMSIFRRVNCSSALLGIWFGFVDFPIYFCRTHFSQRLYGFLSRSFNDKQFVCETYLI